MATDYVLSSAVGSAVVYRFYDTAGTLLYIGMTSVGAARWWDHSIAQPWWPNVATVKVEHHGSAEAALLAERSAIEAEDPLYNVTHRHKPTVARPVRPKRANGTGSIYRDTRERWVAQLSVGPRGKRRKLRAWRHSRPEAEAALVAFLSSDGHGSWR